MTDPDAERGRHADRDAQKLQPFPYYGGKRRHLGFILPRLPQTEQYLEPFGGSAAVLLSREPSHVETYNDVDGDLATFFRVLRDRPVELVRKLEVTPYSREQYEEAIGASGDDSLPDLEQARLFFVRAAQVYSGLAQYATPGRWSYSRRSSVRGMSNAVAGWWADIEDLPAVADRLRRVQIECDDALEVIDRYDHEHTLIYADPPYPMSTRGDAGCGTTKATAYGHEMDDDEHRELAEVLRQAEGKVAVSTYRNGLYDVELDGWHVTTAGQAGISTKHGAEHDEREEALYTNYDPTSVAPAHQSTLEGVSNP